MVAKQMRTHELMDNGPILTIGIPAYRRPEVLDDVLERVSRTDLVARKFQLLIVNDSGREADNVGYRDVVSKFEARFPGTLQYLENTRNEGYPRTFLKLIRECDTPFLMLSADDDYLELGKLDELVNFLASEKPDICSTQFFRGAALKRGSFKLRRVRPTEFRDCNDHAPGVVYRTEGVAEFLDHVESAIERQETVATLYPQTLVAIQALHAERNCWFYPEEFVRDGHRLPSEIEDEQGSSYTAFASRARQIASFEDFILSLSNSEIREEMIFSSRVRTLKTCMASDPKVFVEFEKFFRPSLRRSVARLLPIAAKTQLKKILGMT